MGDPGAGGEQSSIGSDTARLLRVGAGPDARILEEIASDPKCDAGGVLLHDATHRLLAASFTYLRKEWRTLDPSVSPWGPQPFWGRVEKEGLVRGKTEGGEGCKGGRWGWEGGVRYPRGLGLGGFGRD